MTEKLVRAIFTSYTEAGPAIETLTKSNFTAEDISVFGNEKDELRVLAVPIQKKNPDRWIAILGLLGAFVGACAGFLLLGAEPPIGMPLFSALCGAGAGLCFGLVFGIVFDFDIPTHDRRVLEARLSKGKVMVVIRTHDEMEFRRAERIMEEKGAIEILTGKRDAISSAN
ncbi:MAG TPA: hypothetical protein V6D17_22265 [Candidatus Obscuribacterales bacterium]